MTTRRYDYLTLVERPSQHYPMDDTEFIVYGIGTYERSSVLAGQTSRSFLGSYPTKRAALDAYPDAEETGLPPQPVMSEMPPSWFDPADAGEEW
jgi:hypothetical protein